MISPDIGLAILDTIPHPILFVDNDHVIQYLNAPARKRYYEERGLSDLIGKSVFDCHNPGSREKIKEIHAGLVAGEKEFYLGVFKGEKVTVVGVRDSGGKIIGYYERFEKTEALQP
ncbi:MAG: PAS domain-containing protein [Thermodesulfobacteriota bacterium]